jgi:Transketolase, thiamine diphosphate binding domain
MADSPPTPAVKTVPKPRDQHLRDLADCIRFLSMDAVQQAKSGHPGAPMGMADIATVLFRDFMQFDASDPHWFDRDRFVLSNGHASMLLYSLLYLTGFKDMTLDQLKRFRQNRQQDCRPPRIQACRRYRDDDRSAGPGRCELPGLCACRTHYERQVWRRPVQALDLCLHGRWLPDGGSQRGSDLDGHGRDLSGISIC